MFGLERQSETAGCSSWTLPSCRETLASVTRWSRSETAAISKQELENLPGSASNYTHNADVWLRRARARACCCVWRSGSLLSLSPAPPAVFSSSGCRGQCDNGAGATGAPPWPSGVDTLAFSHRGWKLPLLETATVELSAACRMSDHLNVSIERNEAQKTGNYVNLVSKSRGLWVLEASTRLGQLFLCSVSRTW